MKEGKDVIVCMDDNIDSSINNKHNKKYNISNLYNMLMEHINKYSISQCNNEYTRIVSHQQPSCIDKIYCNMPNKICNVRTIDNIESDHRYILARYITNEPVYQPKFILKRNYTELTAYNINDYIERSENLNLIFTSNDSDFIAECLQLELNAIYNALAPGRLTQFKHNYIPYYNSEIKEEIRVCNNMLSKAIE